MPFFGSKAICVLVCLATHTCLHYPITEKKKLAELQRLEEVTILVYCDFVGREYLQRGGYTWPGSHSLRYHAYVIRLSYDLKVAVAFAYGERFRLVKKLAAASG